MRYLCPNDFQVRGGRLKTSVKIVRFGWLISSLCWTLVPLSLLGGSYGVWKFSIMLNLLPEYVGWIWLSGRRCLI